MRIIATIVILLGLVTLVGGVVFVIGASMARQEVADSLVPVTLEELDDKYDAVKAKTDALKAVEEPQIQAGQAMPSAMYNYLSIQRTSLGLARANVGKARILGRNGIVDIVIGAGLVLGGLGLLRKAQA